LRSAHAYSYREWISHSAAERNTKIILALDLAASHAPQVFEKGRTLLRKTIVSLCAVKLGRHTILNMGTERTRRIVELVHDQGIPCVVDDKISDIGETNKAIAESYFRLGFDGLTASPLVGWREGLQPLFRFAHNYGKGVIVLAYMSHPGASEGFGQKVLLEKQRTIPQYLLFARRALQWGADGVVVGATRPKIIENVKRVIGDKVPIYSPGVGAQGGSLATSAKAGTDFFIVGRSITKSSHPEKTAAQLARESSKLASLGTPKLPP